MEEHPAPRKLWEHPDPKGTLMYEFLQSANEKHGLKLPVSDELLLPAPPPPPAPRWLPTRLLKSTNQQG